MKTKEGDALSDVEWDGGGGNVELLAERPTCSLNSRIFVAISIAMATTPITADLPGLVMGGPPPDLPSLR